MSDIPYSELLPIIFTLRCIRAILTQYFLSILLMKLILQRYINKRYCNIKSHDYIYDFKSSWVYL